MGTAEGVKPKKILMVAGEASGDLHGAHLMEAIHRIDPGVEFYGVGGEGMERRGMRCLYRSHSLSVVGITEVLRKLRSIFKALLGLKQSLVKERPDLVVLIDFPDFNLRMAKFAIERVRVLYITSGVGLEGRQGQGMAKWVEKMSSLLFRVPLYERKG
jgi:lipid-A-disaccharide synthase